MLRIALALLLGVLFASTCVSENFKYDRTAAYAKTVETKKTLLIILTSRNCPPCVRLRLDLARQKSEDFNYVFVSVDTDRAYAKLLLNGKTSVPTPTILRLKYVDGRWTKAAKVGYSNMKDLKGFIDG